MGEPRSSPFTLQILWDPKYHKTCISGSIPAFNLWLGHLHALHRELKVISALTFKPIAPNPALLTVVWFKIYPKIS